MEKPGFIFALTIFMVILQLPKPTLTQSGRDNPAILHFVREVQENYNLDLVFILDSSPYVDEGSLNNTAREIVRHVIQHFTYVAPERTRVTIVTYSSSVTIVIDGITNGGDKLKCDFTQDVEIWRKVKYHSQEKSSGSINLASAFDAVKNILADGRNNRKQVRPGLRQIVLVLSSGKFYSQDERDEARRKAISLQQDAGATLHAVALDQYAEYSAIRDLLQIKDFISYAEDWPPAFANQYNNIGSHYLIGKTTAGTAQGQQCHFPFLYKSTLYTSCTTRDNNNVPWCAITSEYRDLWGVCVVDSAEDLRPYNTSRSSCNCQGGSQCVCNVVTGFSQCLCPPGQTWTSNGCKMCPAGTYKSVFGQDDCELCPSRGVTPEGAKRRSQCLCSGVECYDECAIRDHCTGKNQVCATVPGGQSVECRCRKGYSGSSCDFLEDDCRPSPCALGSICIDGHQDYICVCTEDRYGKNCSKILDPCALHQCQRNAECYNRNGQTECHCQRGYTQSGSDCVSINQNPEPAEPTTGPPRSPTQAPNYPLTPTTKIPDPRDSINDVIPDAATDNTKDEKEGKSSGILGLGSNENEQVLLIAIPVCVVVVIAIASTIYALYSVSHNKKRRQRRSRRNSRADTTSEVTQFTASTTVSMSDLKKKHEGFNVNMDAVYGNEPVEYGMGEWYYYTLDLIHNGILNTVAIVRLDGKKWILSPGCYLYKEEIETIYSALTQKSTNVRLSYQRREYGVVNNDDMLMMAHSTANGNDSQQEILCASKTRQFVVICTASFIGDDGKCKVETQRLREHIKSQGL